MRHPSLLRTHLVPDLGTELADAMLRANGILLDMQAADPITDGVPALLCGGAAVTALDEIWLAVRPTQNKPRPRLLAPDGSEHVPLRIAVIADEDLRTFAAAIALLAQLHRADNDMATAVIHLARDRHEQATDVVAEAARLHGLLDLVATPDTNLLTAAIGAAGQADLQLDPLLEAAYRRITERITRMWPLGALPNRSSPT